MDDALLDLKLAEERALFFHHEPDEIAKLQLLRRAIWKVKQQIIERKLSQSGGLRIDMAQRRGNNRGPEV